MSGVSATNNYYIGFLLIELMFALYVLYKKKKTNLSIPQRQTHTAYFGQRENTLNINFSSLWCQKRGKTTASDFCCTSVFA